jgi:hypothetical protein
MEFTAFSSEDSMDARLLILRNVVAAVERMVCSRFVGGVRGQGL